MAPNPPRVSYQNGLLTIDANNSTLGQVLQAVRTQTGASLEMPAGANSQRVVATLGPGRPQDVLNSLLNGSRFDYIILGAVGDPGSVKKVILTTRIGGGTASSVNTAQNNQPSQPAAEDSEDEPVNYGEAETPAQPTPMQPPFRPGTPPGRRMPPGYQPPGSYQPPPPETSDTTQQPNAKTPEQLLQELQQMQQQQEQMEQQLNPANRYPQPQ